MKKHTRNIALTALLVIGIGVLFGFSHQKKKQTNCWSFAIEVNHESGHFFVDENSIRALLAERGVSVLGASLHDIDLASIRETIESESSVRSANVFITADGKLKASVEQRIPILRILNNDGSGMYLDDLGETFPLSQNYTAHIALATGELDEALGKSVKQLQNTNNSQSTLPALFNIAKKLHSNAFWKAQIDHIVVLKNGEFELIPRIGNHRILLGSEKDLEEKLVRLSRFYEETIGQYDLNQYKAINLKYRDQVVCTRW